MDALLALTSFHMASELPIHSSTKAEFLGDALQYQSRSLPAFRIELENVSSINCDALFACSVIMMACTVISPSLGSNTDEKLATIHSIIDQAHSSLDEGPFHFIVQPWSGADPTFLFSEDGALPPVLRKLCCSIDGPSQNIHGHAIDTLEHWALAEMMVIPWIVMAGGEIVDRVQSEEPLALLIYICWGALLRRLEGMWWARVAGKTIVQSLAEHLMHQSEEWDEVVRWAKEIVEIDTL